MALTCEDQVARSLSKIGDRVAPIRHGLNGTVFAAEQVPEEFLNGGIGIDEKQRA